MKEKWEKKFGIRKKDEEIYFSRGFYIEVDIMHESLDIWDYYQKKMSKWCLQPKADK